MEAIRRLVKIGGPVFLIAMLSGCASVPVGSESGAEISILISASDQRLYVLKANV